MSLVTGLVERMARIRRYKNWGVYCPNRGDVQGLFDTEEAAQRLADDQNLMLRDVAHKHIVVIVRIIEGEPDANTPT